MTPVPGAGFSRFLGADPGRLHVAAHSHHPWPDVSFDGQQQAWLDAARLIDGKWDHVFASVLPELRGHVAARLGLPDPDTVAIAPNTHELLVRLLSCLDPPVRVLTTDGEFISFERQIRRLAEDGLVEVERVPVDPLASAAERFAHAAARGGHDLVWFSHVFYGSGGVIGDLEQIVATVPDDGTLVAVDGYHGFMALPTDLSAIADRAFYLAGGYKYAMSGEGVCFAHCPPGYGPRPRDTGWFADFSILSESPDDRIGYGPGGQRFLGATFDPTALYRFNAVQRWLSEVGWTVPAIHRHVAGLQRQFIDALGAEATGLLTPAALVAAPGGGHDHGNLLVFEHPRAPTVTAALRRAGVTVDHRGTRVRVGFGVYHGAGDVTELVGRLRSATLSHA